MLLELIENYLCTDRTISHYSIGFMNLGPVIAGSNPAEDMSVVSSATVG
jgi:hypothetical protein